MSKAKAKLKDLKNLDNYITRLVERRDKIKASLLSSPKWSDIQTTGGEKRKQDDIYVELLTTAEEIEAKAAEALRKQRELESIINGLSYDSWQILTMVYIDKMTVWQVCDRLECSERSYYRQLNTAISEMDDELICQ